MNWLARRAADCADRERLGRFLGAAIITSSDSLLDDLHLSVETGSATLDQRDVGGKTHLVHVAPGIQVVQCVEYHLELLEPGDIELGILDIGMVRNDLNIGIELPSGLLGDLYSVSLAVPLIMFAIVVPRPWIS